MTALNLCLNSQEAPPKTRCLGVFGLSGMTTEETLHHLFSRYGDIRRINIVYDTHVSERGISMETLIYSIKREMTKYQFSIADWSISWFLLHLLRFIGGCCQSERSPLRRGNRFASHTCRLFDNTAAAHTDTGHLQGKAGHQSGTRCKGSWTWTWPRTPWTWTKPTTSTYPYAITTPSSSSTPFTNIPFTINPLTHSFHTIFNFTLILSLK